MNRYLLALGASVACSVSLFMLGEEGESLPAPSEHANDSAAKAEGNASSPEADLQPEERVVLEVESDDVEADITEPSATHVAFEPPFPDRTDIFQAPKRQGQLRSNNTGQSETAVELVGFVNVNGQRVALSIDGLVTTVAEGETQQGIEVISIQPPAVVLQRGRQRWQASFEN